MTGLATYIASWMRTYGRREEGATMVEYGLIVAAIAIVALVGAQLLGANLLGLFNQTAGEL
jgi:pilus assembly protein Flp/PilA